MKSKKESNVEVKVFALIVLMVIFIISIWKIVIFFIAVALALNIIYDFSQMKRNRENTQ